MPSSLKVQLILFFVLLLFTKTACFFEFLKGNRNKENSEANQKALRQKQIQTEQGNQEKVKLLDKISRTRGVPLQDVDRYTKDVFVCDGARKLPVSTVNDGFCDCNDGTDEPGTSACSNSVFYCLNDGYRMTKLSSSRVDDQICDCCDGSDEGILVSCPNTCKQAFEKERIELDRKTAAYRSGSKERAALIEKIRREKTEAASRLGPLQAQVISLIEEKEGYTTKITERSAYVEAKKSQGEQILRYKIDNALHLNEFNLETISKFISSLLHVLSVDENDSNIFSTVSTYTSSPEEGSAVDEPDLDDRDHPRGYEDDDEHEAKAEFNPDATPEATQPAGETEASAPAAAASTTTSTSCVVTDATNDNRLRYLCNEEDPFKAAKSLVYKIIQTKRSVSEPMLLLGYVSTRNSFDGSEEFIKGHLGSALASTCPADFGGVAGVCGIKDSLDGFLREMEAESHEFESVSKEIRELQSIEDDLAGQIAELQQQKEAAEQAQKDLDFYKDHLEYLALKDVCFEVVDGKFSYSLCMLNSVTQKELEGNYNSVVLGHFDSLDASKDGQNVIMHFKRGQHCHAFGDRTADVTVTCGPNNALTAASEPSTCFYTFSFESPVACTPQYAYVNGILLP